MKKLLSLLIILLLTSQTALSMQVDTTNWLNSSDKADIFAFELDLKSDLKHDFRYYQVSLTNKTQNIVDLTIHPNKKANDNIIKIEKENYSLKELMQVPKEIAVESYKEDVGTGKIAKAHKGLIYLSTTAGAAAAGAGFLGLYPQQKFEEYFTHKKIKKEYSKIVSKIQDKLTLEPLEQVDFIMLVPLDEPTPFIEVVPRENDEQNEFHQL